MIVFDTSLLFALHHSADTHHGSALEVQQQFDTGVFGRGLLLEYVMVEMMNLLSKRRGTATAAAVGRAMLGSNLHFVRCSPLFDGSFKAFCRQRLTRLGLVDIAVAEFARTHAGGYVATFDRELSRQPGIVAIPG